MTNLDDVRFFGRTKCILSHPIRVRRKVKVGLFRSRIEEVYVCLFFYVKDGRTIEFVTKEDISDIFPHPRTSSPGAGYGTAASSRRRMVFTSVSFRPGLTSPGA